MFYPEKDQQQFFNFVFNYFYFFTKFLQLKFKLFVFYLLSSNLSSLYLFPEVKFRLMDSTLYQLGFIEPEQDYVEIQVNEKNMW